MSEGTDRGREGKEERGKMSKGSGNDKRRLETVSTIADLAKAYTCISPVFIPLCRSSPLPSIYQQANISLCGEISRSGCDVGIQ